MNSLVSIVMPAYNSERFIGAAIRSVLDQTYRDWELLIVDDCSTDSTREVVRSFADNRISLLLNSENSGAAMSRNKAIREAKGRWIAFLDSDDLWHPSKLEMQIGYMEKNGLSFTCTYYCCVDECGIISEDVITAPRCIDKKMMYRYCYPGALTVVYDSDAVGLVQVCDLRKNNDYAMWLQIIEREQLICLESCLAVYRRRAGSISSGNKVLLLQHHYFLFRRGLQCGRLRSLLYIGRNIFFGIAKKLMCRKKMDSLTKKAMSSLLHVCTEDVAKGWSCWQ